MQTTSAPFPEPAPPVLTRASLRPDCANCFALCCTALGFTRSADFAVDKPAGSACSNLSAADYSCTIHDSLRPRGFRGCTVFDCLGAGQTVSQGLFGGQSWRQHPETQNQMFAAFRIVRQLHEMLWHLTEAQERTFDPDLSLQAARLRTGIERFIGGGLAALLDLDVQNLHLEVRALLIEVSEEVRAPYFAAGGDHLEPALQPGADLMGHSLKFRQLCGADLRGADLIEADLRGSVRRRPPRRGSAGGPARRRGSVPSPVPDAAPTQFRRRQCRDGAAAGRVDAGALGHKPVTGVSTRQWHAGAGQGN